MKRQIFFFLLAALLASRPMVALAVAPGDAEAAAEARRCRDNRGVDRCEAAQQARVRALFQMPTIEAHRDAGDQVRRAFYVDGYGHDMVALSFVRARGHDPELRVHFPHQAGVPDAPPMVAPVLPDEWQALIDRSELFDRALLSPPPPPADTMVLCIHGWVFTVEAADPARREGRDASVRRRTENACEDGLTEAYAVEMYRAALRMMPICAGLGAREDMHPVSRLANCRYLEGDRLAAAAVMNLLDPLFDLPESGELEQVGPLFHYEASVDWNGERTPPGERGDAVARFFLAKWAEESRPNFYVDSIVGERLDLVRFHGGFLRTIPASGDLPVRYERALVEMVLEGEDDDFQIRTARVGPFEPFVFP